MGNNAFSAVTPVNDGENVNIEKEERLIDKIFPVGVELTPKQSKRKAKLEKALGKIDQRISKLNSKRAKKGKATIDLDDPVRKWMWLAILAGAGALALSILGGLFNIAFLWRLSYLLWFAGVVFAAIWLVKEFG